MSLGLAVHHPTPPFMASSLVGIGSSDPDEDVGIRGKLWNHLASQVSFLKYYPAIQTPFVV